MLRTSSIASAHLGRGQPGQRLVQQQQLRLGRQRAGDLQPLAPRRAQGAGRACRPARARPVKSSTSSALRARVATAAVAQEGADHDVLGHRHVLERRRHLEGARHAQPGVGPRARRGDVVAVEADPPAVGGRSPARQLKKVLLPAPFGPIRPMISPSAISQVGAVHRAEAAERLDDLRASSSTARPPRCDAGGRQHLGQAAGREAGDQHDDAAVDDEGDAGAAAAERGVGGLVPAGSGSPRRAAARTACRRRPAPRRCTIFTDTRMPSALSGSTKPTITAYSEPASEVNVGRQQQAYSL